MDTTFLTEYSKNFPDVQDVRSRRLSEQERFIKSQPPIIKGNFIAGDNSPKELNFDWSKFSIAYLQVAIRDAKSLFEKEWRSSGEMLLTESFLNTLVNEDDEKPKFVPSIEFFDCSNPHPPEDCEVVHIYGDIHPVLFLSETEKILYKLDIEVFAEGCLPVKRRNRESKKVLVAVIQKHFIADKEGLIFHKEAKKALHDSLSQIKNGFVQTSWKTVVFV